MKIILIRHGETFSTINRQWYGYGFRIFSAPILEEGKPTIIRAAEFLKTIDTDYHLASPFRRCRETAEIISKVTGKQFIFDRRLGELFEPFWLFKRRVLHIARDIENSSYNNILICTHGAVIASLTHYFMSGNINIKNLSDFPRPGVISIIENKKLTQLNFNNPIQEELSKKS
ncbi:MAG TPA: phosphoglycerate mutase family protein [Candidatus Nitrosocosmicus sp.]|nr:phosphoglycerate mutase family protein [Candidatus Nitrosocosmicus sp.]